MPTHSEPTIAQPMPINRRAELRAVFAMAIPSAIIHSSRAIMDATDYALISYLGVSEAQAAVLSAQLVVWSYMTLGLGTASMINTYAAQLLGRGKKEQTASYAWHVLYLSLAFGALGFALHPFLPFIFSWIGHDSSVQQMEVAYASISLASVAPTIASHGLSAYYIGIQRPRLAMWSVIEANGINVLATLIMMYGWFGFPPMGFVAAAWGTLIAVCYRTLRLAAPLVRTDADREFKTPHAHRLNTRKLVDLLRVGIPVGLQWVGEVIVWTVFVGVLVGRLSGTADLIATTTAWQYMRLSFLPIVGVGQAVTSLVGRAIGARDLDRAKRDARTVASLALVYMGTISIVFWCWGGPLIAQFNNDPDVVRIGARVMQCVAVFQVFDVLAIIYVAALRGAGDTFTPAIVLIVATWVIVIGGGSLMAWLVPQWRSLGPWTAAATLIVIIGIYMWRRWQSGKWRKIDIFRTEPARS